MPLFKATLRFLGIFSVVYFIMLLPQFGIGDTYAGFHRSAGEWLFGDFGEKGNGKV